MPGPRVRHRQRTCGSEACRRSLKARTQAEWARRNPDYWAERRLREQLARVEAGEAPTARPPPRLVEQIPLDLVQDEIGAKAIVIILLLARLLQRSAQDEIARQGADIRREFGRVLVQAAQDETDAAARAP